jgi:hypothetical protein
VAFGKSDNNPVLAMNPNPRIQVRTILLALSLLGLGTIGILFSTHPSVPKKENSAGMQETKPPAATPLKLALPGSRTTLRAVVAPRLAPPELPEDLDELREWTRRNPQDALAWMLNAPAGEKRDAVVEIACALIAEYNPAEAVSLAERYSGASSNLLENMVQQWAEQDEASAYAYTINRSPGEERDRLFSRVAFARSKENPAEAANLVAEWIAPGEVQDEAAMSVLHQWALRDSNAALAWVQLFPKETLRDRAVNEVAMMLRNKLE